MSAIEPTRRIDRRGARGIVLDGADHVLFIGGFAGPERRASWLLPGGGINPGETMAEAAIRELFEETGLRLAPRDLIGPVARQLYIDRRKAEPFTQENHFFFTRAERFEPHVCGGDLYEQSLEFNWIATADLTATDGLAKVEALQALIKRLAGGDVPAAPVQLAPTGPGG